jgi:ectoine hydroxylase-related dioxygenase (phytanoyl-CoA dioxygenase family)
VKDDDKAISSSGVFVGLAAHHHVFRQAVSDDRLIDTLEAIIGPNIEFLSDKVVIKDPDRDFASPWHQDWPYWKGSHKISVWVALDDATPDNGCLKLLSGSHRHSVAHDGKVSDQSGFVHRLRSDAVDEGLATTAAIPAGGAVFFHDLTLHASHPNTARRERWVWIPTYRDAQADDPAYSWAVANTVVRGTAHHVE